MSHVKNKLLLHKLSIIRAIFLKKFKKESLKLIHKRETILPHMCLLLRLHISKNASKHLLSLLMINSHLSTQYHVKVALHPLLQLSSSHEVAIIGVLRDQAKPSKCPKLAQSALPDVLSSLPYRFAEVPFEVSWLERSIGVVGWSRGA